MDKIILPEINIMACHGVYAAEKTSPQPFRISVQAGLDLACAALSDDVADTIHYGELYLQIKSFAEQNCFNLIETLAEKIAQLILSDQRICYALVEIEKKQACHEGHTFPAIVRIERNRNE